MPPYWLKKKVFLSSPPFSPNLAPGDNVLFPGMNQNLKGRRLVDVAEVQRESLAAFHSISVKDYRHCFQQWVRR
jgi:hypothetical protein